MEHRDRNHLNLSSIFGRNIERALYRIKLYMRFATTHLCHVEDVVEAFTYYAYHFGAAIDWHRTIECHRTDIIQAVQVVGMGVGNKHGIGSRKFFPQHLNPELRGHIYDYVSPLGTYIYRAAGPVVPGVSRCTYRAVAAYDRDAVGCPCP